MKRMRLTVDNEIESVKIRRRFFFRVARDEKEYERTVIPSVEFLRKLEERGVDVFSFVERKWCSKIQNPQESWVSSDENIALLNLKSYDEWWKEIGKKTRNMVRKAEKSGVRTSVAKPDGKLAEGIWKIYNRTPIRQERASLQYGITLQQVKTSLISSPSCTYIGAYFQDELAGFVQLVHGDNITVISQILSLKKYWDKAVNNALIAKAVETCASKGLKWMVYGKMGDWRRSPSRRSSLDDFKLSNGFRRFQLTRYYIPITKKGELAFKLGLHRKDMLPSSIKYSLVSIYCWLSRNRIRFIAYLKQWRTNNK